MHGEARDPVADRALAALVLVTFAYAMSQAILLPALPAIRADLGASQAAGGWLLTAYLISAAVGTLLAGRLGDLHGKRRVLLLLLGVLAVGTAVCAVAGSLPVLVGGRALQGASGGILPLALGIVREALPPDRAMRGVGVISSLLGGGAAVGILAGGVIAEQASYPWIFVLLLALVVLAWAVSTVWVPDDAVRSTVPMSWGSGALASLALTTALLGVSQGASWGWLAPETVGLVALGLLTAVTWLHRERRSAAPVVDLAVMRLAVVWRMNLATGLFGAAMYGIMLLLPSLVLQPPATEPGIGAATPLSAALFLLPFTCGLLLVGQLAHRIARLAPPRVLPATGALLMLAGIAGLLAGRQHAWAVLVAAGVLGVGNGLGVSFMPVLVMRTVPPEQTSATLGVNTVARMVGGAVGAQVAASLLGTFEEAGRPTGTGYDAAFAAVALAIALAWGVCRPGRVPAEHPAVGPHRPGASGEPVATPPVRA